MSVGARRGTAAALALSALASGCGSSTLSHGDFVRRADAICTAYRDATKNVAKPRTYGQVVTFVKKTLPLYESALRQLQALKPPSRDADAVHEWLRADRAVATATRELGDAGERRDYPSINAALARTELASSRGRRAAAGLGLQVCARIATGR